MATEQDKQARWHIHESADGGKQFVLHPENDELFIRTGKQVIEACRLGISLEVWFHERNSMFDHVLRWASDEARAQRIRGCYAAPRQTGISLFFVPRSDCFDFDLADELAVLNTQLIQSYNIGPLEIGQIPAGELERFLVPEEAVLIYDADGSHQSVAP